MRAEGYRRLARCGRGVRRPLLNITDWLGDQAFVWDLKARGMEPRREDVKQIHNDGIRITDDKYNINKGPRSIP